MSSGSGGIPDPLRRSLEQGLEAAFAADSLTQLADAVDFDGLAAGDPEAMNFEQMGELVGQMTGRLVVKRTIGQFTPGQIAEQTVGYAIGGAIGREGGRLILRVVEDQRGDPVEVDIEVHDEEEIDELDEFTDLEAESPEENEEGVDVEIEDLEAEAEDDGDEE
ncbi:hypothetical protein ACFQKF_16500 [Halalkalicoccus sp. GCM10025322]|uniref:hypothetical protein n=1 Tax=Halalkalicoccus TaxID=332246 RepID=UPI002F9653C4